MMRTLPAPSTSGERFRLVVRAVLAVLQCPEVTTPRHQPASSEGHKLKQDLAGLTGPDCSVIAELATVVGRSQFHRVD